MSAGVALALALALSGAGADTRATVALASGAAPSRDEGRKMKIRIRVGDRAVTATLQDSAAARDFAKLLPLTISMHDLFGREKAGQLPRAISEQGQRTRTYEVGQIAYWAPATDVAIFYRRGGPSIPDPGIIVLGAIDSGVEALAFEGSGAVTFEVAE